MNQTRLTPNSFFGCVCVLLAVGCNLPVWSNAADQPAFAARRVFNAGSYPFAVAVGDFNNDGIPDLAAADFSSPGGVAVMLGHGDGTFQPVVIYTAAPYLNALITVDVNHDGNLDLVANGLSEG